jgi:hypothetical protein
MQEETFMSRLFRCGFFMLVLVLCGVTGAYGQSTGSIAGVVRDVSGGIVPGASVVVKEDQTGIAFQAVTGVNGSYQVPALQAGSYTVTVSLKGFKTAEAKGIRLAPGQPMTLNFTLEIGNLTETVIVLSDAELINATTATVAATLSADQLIALPTATRNALNAVTFLPGVNTAGANRDSTINGLPESFYSITLDGVSNNDNFLRSSDGFFASVYPRQDAVEAVAVTVAAAGAQTGGGTGAVTMAFQTRSGGNRFSGSAYEYYRNPNLNSNYYYNELNHLDKNDVILHQYGFRVGGPIYIPWLFDGRDKAFFFVNYEQVRFPNSFTRTRTALNTRAVDGWFRYQYGSTVREVNVLDLARTNNQIYATNSTVISLLRKIEAAMATTGTRSAQADPLLDQYVFQSPGKLFEHQPTVRVDYNLTNNHRLSGSFATITAQRDPDYLNSSDARFPGAPNFRLYTSTRPLMSATLRSTLSPRMVNELRGGLVAFYGFSNFGAQSSNGKQSFADQEGYAIDFDSNIGLTNWFYENGFSWRRAPTVSLDEILTWQRGTHGLSFGGSFLQSDAQENAIAQMVPGINLGMSQQFDPAAGLFTTGNFSGASSAQLSDARDLYALLTGRVSSVTGTAALDAKTNKYTAFGERSRQGRIRVFGVFAQDTWRAKPTLTLSLGLRWDLQTPFSALNNIMSTVTLDSICGMSGIGDGGLYSKCNFLHPGAKGGKTPEFIQLKAGTEGYNTDWNNIAPSLSVAWRPNVSKGFLRMLLGNPDQATIRAGWSVAYERQGMNAFTGVYGANPGSTVSLSRSESTGLVPAGESWPVLFSQKSRLYNASFPETATFPIAIRANRADSLYAFAPDYQIGRAMTWQVGFQRSVTNSMALEVRYVGTRGTNQLSTLNYNSIRGENIVANGFINEFKLAMANLVANNSSGVTNRIGSFAYFGPNTGTNPLPTYLAYFSGRTDATNAAAYTGGSSTWTNSTFASRFSPANPNPISSAGDLDGNSTRRGYALQAGLVPNLFVPNPEVSGVNVTDSGAFSDYHALQIELRRRLSSGLQANVNYQYARERGSAFDGFSYGRTMVEGANVRHAIKSQWDWTIPIGREKRFGSTLHPILNGLVGGWSIAGVGRIQTRVMDFGSARLIGMTKDEFQEMYKYYFKTNATSGIGEVWMMPDDVILNTRRAFSVTTTTVDGYSTSLGPPEGKYLAPANTPTCMQMRGGDCGVPRNLLIRAPWFVRFDVGATKRFRVHGDQMNIEVRIDMLNLLDNINFNPTTSYGSGATSFQVTSAYTDPSNTYDPGGRLGQLMIRFNW